MNQYKSRFSNGICGFVYLLTVLAICAYPQLLKAEWPDVDIDLVTCRPDGIIAGMKERYDPLKFWIKQNVKLEMALEDEDLKFLIQDCRINHPNDREELMDCISSYKNRHEAMVKCYQHTKRKCNQLGGNCR